jgi:transcriptional regulator with XRE-family HTH domain
MARTKRDLLSPGVLDDISDGSLADKLMLLFETRLSPDLDPFTLLEVAEGTGGNISPTYLMNLRDGKFSNPSMSKIKALSKFFGVPITYFYDDEGADTLREEIREDFFKALDALTDEEVRRQIVESTTPRAQSIVINIVKNKTRAN